MTEDYHKKKNKYWSSVDDLANLLDKKEFFTGLFNDEPDGEERSILLKCLVIIAGEISLAEFVLARRNEALEKALVIANNLPPRRD